MPDELLFEVESPFGYVVTLRRLTWESHEARRPEIVGQLENVARSIQEPHVVIESGVGRIHFYRMGHGQGRTRNCYLHVLVRERGDDHVVATAWFTPSLEKGEITWYVEH